MTNPEFSNEFDVLYNNIMSNAAPGLDEYEKSVFLTKAQDEIVKSYFNPRLNKSQEGFDGNEKRQIDFSMIMKTKSYIEFKDAELDDKPNTKKVSLDSDIMMFINEFADVSSTLSVLKREMYVRIYDSDEKELTYDAVIAKLEEGIISEAGTYYAEVNGDLDGTKLEITVYTDEGEEIAIISIPTDSFREGTIKEVSIFFKDVPTGLNERRLVVIPLDYKEYSRLMNKPYKRPLKNLAWRIITNDEGSNNAEIIIGPNDNLVKYVIRYIKKPRAIRLANFDTGVTLEGQSTALECELDSILHQEILQRAVELAKAAYTGDLNSQIALGVNSQTNLGMVASK